MTDEGARRTIIEYREIIADVRLRDALDMAINALEKLIPVKTFVGTGGFIRCSHCHSIVKNIDRYCHECGQKLDWSKEE